MVQLHFLALGKRPQDSEQGECEAHPRVAPDCLEIKL